MSELENVKGHVGLKSFSTIFSVFFSLYLDGAYFTISCGV